MPSYVVMGVTGCGKTSVGEALAARSDLSFIDGDDLHPAANIAKMASGVPLDDDDRAPWLRDVGKALAASGVSTVIGCSALKRAYRDIIRSEAGGPVHFLHLDAAKDVIAERLNARAGHFMPPELLESQCATLEPLQSDENGKVIDIDRPLEDVVADAASYVKGTLT
jgi:carbohydrate kinase (thermoresistant glucokinase family)